jgi:hypothetical protein
MDCARRLARSEGIFTGTSGGGCLAVALRLARKAKRGSTIVAMLPDTGERCVSRPRHHRLVLWRRRSVAFGRACACSHLPLLRSAAATAPDQHPTQTMPAAAAATIACDRRRASYLSTPLFDDVPADMTEEEKRIAASTPSAPPPPAELPAVDDDARAFVTRTNKRHKLVVYSLEYCEFCWTLFKLLDALRVPYEVWRRARARLASRFRRSALPYD